MTTTKAPKKATIRTALAELGADRQKLAEHPYPSLQEARIVRALHHGGEDRYEILRARFSVKHQL